MLSLLCRFFAILFLVAILSSSLARSQNVTLTAEVLLDTFKLLGLSHFGNLTEKFLDSPEGREYLTQLSTGDHIIFAVDELPASQLPSSLSSDPLQLSALFSYHHIFGSIDPERTTIYPNTTIRQTGLDATSQRVFLEGNKSQLIAWSHESHFDTRFSFLDQPAVIEQNAGAAAGTHSDLLTIMVLSDFLNIPGSLFTAHIQPKVLTSMEIFGRAGIADEINETHGVSFFLPTDDAIANFPQNLTALSLTNSTAFGNILRNHVINGSTLYTPNFISMGISSTDAISSSGEFLGFSTNSSGTYVHSFNSTARIVQSDIILENGVVHVVDAVLWNEMGAPEFASSAFASATGAAVLSANQTQTGPIGFTPSPTPTQSTGAATKVMGISGMAPWCMAVVSLMMVFTVF